MDNDIKYRKRQVSLKVSGGAIIAMQAWILIKSVLQLLGNMDMITASMENSGIDDSFPIEIVVMIVCDIIFIIYFIFNYRLGKAAIEDAVDHRRDKNGKRKKPYYLIGNVIFLVISIFIFWYNFQNITVSSLDLTIISGILYFLNIMFYVQMLFSAIQINAIRRKAEAV